jgi:CMP-N-acetylneuraminic acid synthetase
MKKKIVGLMIGKKTSYGVPGKNIFKIHKKHLFEFPLLSAIKSKSLDKLFISTDCPIIKKKSKKYGAQIIERPKKIQNPETLTEDVLFHAHEHIKKDLGGIKNIKYYVLLYANGAFVNSKLINQAIKKLEKNSKFDSCVGVVNADMFTPIRAKQIDKNNSIKPFIKLKHFKNITSNRDSAGKVYFMDLSLQIIKPICFEKMNGNQKPFLWLGNKILPFEKEFGGDVDAIWQFTLLKDWLEKNFK